MKRITCYAKPHILSNDDFIDFKGNILFAADKNHTLKAIVKPLQNTMIWEVSDKQSNSGVWEFINFEDALQKYNEMSLQGEIS